MARLLPPEFFFDVIDFLYETSKANFPAIFSTALAIRNLVKSSEFEEKTTSLKLNTSLTKGIHEAGSIYNNQAYIIVASNPVLRTAIALFLANGFYYNLAIKDRTKSPFKLLLNIAPTVLFCLTTPPVVIIEDERKEYFEQFTDLQKNPNATLKEVIELVKKEAIRDHSINQLAWTEFSTATLSMIINIALAILKAKNGAFYLAQTVANEANEIRTVLTPRPSPGGMNDNDAFEQFGALLSPRVINLETASQTIENRYPITPHILSGVLILITQIARTYAYQNMLTVEEKNLILKAHGALHEMITRFDPAEVLEELNESHNCSASLNDVTEMLAAILNQKCKYLGVDKFSSIKTFSDAAIAYIQKNIHNTWILTQETLSDCYVSIEKAAKNTEKLLILKIAELFIEPQETTQHIDSSEEVINCSVEENSLCLLGVTETDNSNSDIS